PSACSRVLPDFCFEGGHRRAVSHHTRSSGAPHPPSTPSSRRKPGGGFTFEVQQSGEEELGWGLVGKALSWGAGVGSQEGEEAFVWEVGEVGLSGKEATQSTDGVLDTSLLPGRVRVAEEGLDVEGVQAAMASKLGSIIEGEGLPKRRGQSGEEGKKLLGDGL